jgi:hypothetical protein
MWSKTNKKGEAMVNALERLCTDFLQDIGMPEMPTYSADAVNDALDELDECLALIQDTKEYIERNYTNYKPEGGE